MFIINGEEFTDEEFDLAMEQVKLINPVMAGAIEGASEWREDED